ncbi:MAG: putative DNA binding domain-containing protein [Spirochaetes bacterium]|nr:putative DNA binding domain-containing protein [Spirochaetota bacterium]
MNIKEILNMPEGRKLEFKEKVTNLQKIAETVIAFTNSSGGEIYVGINDKTRQIIGIDESEIFKLEEQIANTVYDNCYPVIIPEILILNVDEKLVLKIVVYPGSNKPYYLKNLGKNKGTIIRVGSSNRKADVDIIEELERQRRNISFDSVPVYDINSDNVDLSEFNNFFVKETGKKVTKQSFNILNLFKIERDRRVITNAALLLSNNKLKKEYFPYAKLECARFKGTTTNVILDQLTIDGPIFSQPEEAMTFIKRNIALGSTIGEVYRKERWEYPLEAIREAVINAVIHRDYSILGSDIKIAIFDDMLEITSPGTLLSSINIDNIENNSSEIRNRVLAPIFKECQLIEQWGTGFKKIKEQLNITLN